MSDDNRQKEFSRLIADLEQGDESSRRYAAEDLEYGGYREAVPYLAKALGDASVAVAEACASALANLGGPEVAEVLVGNLASEDVRLRNLSSEVLSRLGDVAVPALARQLQSLDRDVRKFAVDSLLAIRSDDSMKALVVALDDNDVNISATAADGLGEIGNSDHLEILAAYLDTEDEWMKCAVIRGITTIGGLKALRLVRHYLTSEEMVVRITCIQGIGKLHFPEAAAEMIQVLRGEDLGFFGGEMTSALDQITQALSPEQMAQLDLSGLAQPLSNLAKEGSTEHRLTAIDLIGRFKLEAAKDALVGLLGEADAELRERAILALGELPQADLEPYRVILSKPEGPLSEKEAALKVASKGTGPQVEALFLESLRQGDPQLVAAVLENLPESVNGPQLKQELARMIGHQQAEIRLAAAHALGRSEDSEMVSLLVAQLQQETEPDVKDAIDGALIQIGTRNVNSGVRAYVQSFTPEERAMALELYGFEDPLAHREKILAALGDEHPHLRVISFKVLANLEQLTYELIERGIADSDPAVQVEAVRGLGMMPTGPELSDFVKKYVEEGTARHERVDVELIQLLVQKGMDEAGVILRPFLHSPSDWVKIEAVEAYKTLGDVSVLDELKAMLDGAEEDLLEALEQAIYELE
ncbi:MAG: HEAT repeat domain-containing protein [bacterium]|nr:HEAT repeat domain-containing protein [bacterium]